MCPGALRDWSFILSLTRISRITGIALLLCAATAHAQLPNEDYRGVSATGIALRKLATTKRVLVIGAHPDDEDTQLMTLLSLRDGADVAYLSLNRGEGGQNSIGGELGPALGVLRTSELLAARELDRGQQFFTRALDFGFSKTADETIQHWPRDSVFADVVAIVRRYRPDVIIAIFSGTPRDGHGHHQLSGIMAREAFTAAADPNRFPGQIRAGLRPHTTLRLFQATSFRGGGNQRFETGVVDPLFGRSFSQIAAASRSRHRSQDMGSAQTPGPRTASVGLIQSTVPVSDSTLFAGIDTTISMRAAATRESAMVARALQRYDSLVAAAQQSLSAYSTERVAELLASALRELQTAAPAIKDFDVRFAAHNEIATAQRALLQASGVVIDALADNSSPILVPGQTFTLRLQVWNTGNLAARIVQLEPMLPANWQAERVDTAGDAVAPGALVTRSYRVTLPAAAAISQPYFLAQPRPGDYYAWPTDDNAGLPFQRDPVQANAIVETRGVQAQTTVVATRRSVDPRQGELRTTLHVAPAFALHPDPTTSVVTLAALKSGSKRAINVSVEVLSNGAGGDVVVRPELPAGWRATPMEARLAIKGQGETGTVRFAIEPPATAQAGQYAIRMVAIDAAGRSYDQAQRAIDYPHIKNRLMFEPALLQVTVLDANFARGTRVGYIVGIDEPVARVLEEMGVSVDRLDANALANADLSKYDAVVIGSRAYEVRPDLIAHNARVLDYARNGGNVVTLYQQYEFIQGKFAPFELSIARPHDRITDENAPVKLLDPSAQALSRPNQIGEADFNGWVQERALYMPDKWSSEYKALMEMSDPGEAPKQGAILIAPLGKGYYTYTGIAFFREIPAGVPGALRLFINLLSQGIKDVNF
jgi:LmbE family N-acetylglucosaminyl deacetylase